MWTFEPHVAEEVFEDLLKEEQIAIFRQQRLDRESGVTVRNNMIRSIRTQQGSTFNGRMFVDSTYEGDLMAAAGVSYTVGRENNSRYGETLNGVQKNQNIHNHRFPKLVDPYVTPGESSQWFIARHPCWIARQRGAERQTGAGLLLSNVHDPCALKSRTLR